jgi:hypothetical protein
MTQTGWISLVAAVLAIAAGAFLFTTNQPWLPAQEI